MIQISNQMLSILLLSVWCKDIPIKIPTADAKASAIFMSKKLSFAALLLQTLVYITHALHFRCNFVTYVDADFSSRYNESPKGLWEIFFLNFFKRLEESKCLI